MYSVSMLSHLHAVADFLLPPRCFSCNAIIARDGALCAGCWSGIAFLAPPCCVRCGHPFDLDPGPGALCGACVQQPPAFARARAVFRYDRNSRGMVLKFKHGDRTAFAPAFAAWMARAGGELLADADLLVPVPLHWRRLFDRRYNQAALLAGRLAGLSGKAWHPLALQRLRNTPSQGSVSGAQRRANVRAAFRVRHPDRLAGRRILLIDDVLTTAATVDECARTALGAGATAVDVLTLARVVYLQG